MKHVTKFGNAVQGGIANENFTQYPPLVGVDIISNGTIRCHRVRMGKSVQEVMVVPGHCKFSAFEMLEKPCARTIDEDSGIAKILLLVIAQIFSSSR